MVERAFGFRVRFVEAFQDRGHAVGG